MDSEGQPGSPGNPGIHLQTSALLLSSFFSRPMAAPLENDGIFLYNILSARDSMVPYRSLKDCIFRSVFLI